MAEGGSKEERVVELLNNAQLEEEVKERLKLLKEVQEILIHLEPALLDNFLEEVLQFQHDQAGEIRKFVPGFIESAVKLESRHVLKVVDSLLLLIEDPNVQVVKAVVLAHVNIYQKALQYVAKHRFITNSGGGGGGRGPDGRGGGTGDTNQDQEVREMWQQLQILKDHIVELCESPNTGVKSAAIKNVEMLVIALSFMTQVSDGTRAFRGVSLDIVPATHPFLRVQEMREEGQELFNMLLGKMTSPDTIGGTMVVIAGTVAKIAEHRPIFIEQVVTTLVGLHDNLPESFNEHMISTVNNALKRNLFRLLQHTSSVGYHHLLVPVLTTLGVKSSEIDKYARLDDIVIPTTSAGDADGSKRGEKRAARDALDRQSSSSRGAGMSGYSKRKRTEELSRENAYVLTDRAAVEIVLETVKRLPEAMPYGFQYRVTDDQAWNSIKDTARYQLENVVRVGMKDPEASVYLEGKEPGRGVGMRRKDSKGAGDVRVPRKRKRFELEHVELTSAQKHGMMMSLFRRILSKQKNVEISGSSDLRLSLLARLVNHNFVMACDKHLPREGSMFMSEDGTKDDPLTKLLLEFFASDVRKHYDVAVVWLCYEFIARERYAAHLKQHPDEQKDEVLLKRYAFCCTKILSGAKSKLDPRDQTITRLFLDCPEIPNEGLEFLKLYCEDPVRLDLGLTTLYEVINQRPVYRKDCLDIVLKYCNHHSEKIRVAAIKIADQLFQTGTEETKKAIEDSALATVDKLTGEPPNYTMSVDDEGQDWTEEDVLVHLYLYFALCLRRPNMLDGLFKVYIEAGEPVKKAIRKHIKTLVKALGSSCEWLLHTIEHFPAGGEVLILRILHILTEDDGPSKELVDKVKSLYYQRVEDVRFLLPILSGLEKSEILNVLPKLISGTEAFVKEAIRRLLTTSSENVGSSRLSPSELLVALHTISPRKDNVDLNSIIKAISMCFAQKNVYTQEVLAVVLQQLVDMSPLPILFMRSVIIAVKSCPKLVNFVMSILSRLITKQIWTNPKLWEGFIYCCKVTAPNSYNVLLQLPYKKLRDVLEQEKDVKEKLREYAEGQMETAGVRFSKQILTVLGHEKKV
eukprot:Nk52_evm13s1945 gene=Nk52_evmTU13s1945